MGPLGGGTRARESRAREVGEEGLGRRADGAERRQDQSLKGEEPPRWRLGGGKTGDAVRVIRREGRTDRRDGSEVGREGSRSTTGPGTPVPEPRVAGIRKRREVGTGKGVW